MMAKVARYIDEFIGWMTSLSVADYIPLFSLLFYVVACPFTKVEESFNMQAIHDLLNYHVRIQEYDHLQFPGVVPRTFLGAIVVAGISIPFNLIMLTFSLPGLYHQILVRMVLGMLGWVALVSLRRSITKVFGHRSGQLFMVSDSLY